jgi:hypothetical protein
MTFPYGAKRLLLLFLFPVLPRRPIGIKRGNETAAWMRVMRPHYWVIPEHRSHSFRRTRGAGTSACETLVYASLRNQKYSTLRKMFCGETLTATGLVP